MENPTFRYFPEVLECHVRDLLPEKELRPLSWSVRCLLLSVGLGNERSVGDCPAENIS